MRRACFMLFGWMVLVGLTGCGDDNAPEYADEYDRHQAAAHGRETGSEIKPIASTANPMSTNPMSANPAPPAPTIMAHTLRGTVRETMDAGRYTYLRLETDGGLVWAAATKMDAAVGDTVELSGAATMHDFHSETLDRTFESILFVSNVHVVGDETATAKPETPASVKTPATVKAQALPPGHPPMETASPPPAGRPAAAPKPGEIEKLADGQSVAELFAHKAELTGKKVRLRGRVVKGSRGIMGLNWLHIQDGTGKPGSDDVTVTSASDFAEVGTIVVVEGTLDVDKAVGKDLGMNYFFPVIIENATIMRETSKRRNVETSK